MKCMMSYSFLYRNEYMFLKMFSFWSLFSGYIAMFIHPFTWSFYTASVLVGVAAAGTVSHLLSNSTNISYLSSPFHFLICIIYFFSQCCGQLRGISLLSIPVTPPLAETVGYSGHCCSLGVSVLLFKCFLLYIIIEINSS